MTQSQSTRSRVLRRVGIAIAAAVTMSTMATTGGSASAAAGDIDYDATAKVAIYDTFSGWCFANNLANSALMAGRTIYETLFEKTTTNELVGLLAVSGKPKPGTGMKIWEIKLREGIKFHDGTDFNAQAVVDNWSFGSAGDGTDTKTYFGALAAELGNLQKILETKGKLSVGDEQTGATNGWKSKVTSKQLTAFTKAVAKEIKAGGSRANPAKYLLVGLASAAGKSVAVSNLSYMVSTAVAFSSNIVAAVPSGEYEVTYLLDHAQNDFLGTTYASGRSFQRAPSQFNDGSGADCVNNAIGTGPFQLDRVADWKVNELKVVRNDSYWRKDAKGGKLPYLKEIKFVNVKETAQRANAVVRGTYDAAMFGSGDGKFNLTLRKNKTAVTEIRSAVEYYPSLWLNQGKPGSPFANKDARLAVMTCIDRIGYLKVRAANEGNVAKSLVGPSNIMYTTSGFLGKLEVDKSKRYVAKYKAATGKKLTFTIPSDISTTSVANIKFLQDQWKKCGITAVAKKSEAADIIAKAFNASPDQDAGEYYNAYDAIAILLMEGSDATFNMPFVLTNAYSTLYPDEAKYGKDPVTGKAKTRAWGVDDTLGLKQFYTGVLASKYGAAAGTVAAGIEGAVGVKAALFSGSIGTVLGLNHHSDIKVDELFYAAQGASEADAKAKYAEATAYLQANGTMTSIVHGYYNMFYNKKAGLKGFGELTLPQTTDVAAGFSSTGTTKQRKISNWGVDWTGVYKVVK